MDVPEKGFLFQSQPPRLLAPSQVVVPTRVGQVYVYDTVRPEQEEYDVPPRHQPPGQQDIYDIPPSRQQSNPQVRLPTGGALMTTVNGVGSVAGGADSGLCGGTIRGVSQGGQPRDQPRGQPTCMSGL